MGEIVDITVLPTSAFPTFSLTTTGNGTLTSTLNPAELTAGDQAESDVLTTTIAGIPTNTTFTVIEPSAITGTKMDDVSVYTNEDGTTEAVTEPGGAGMQILLTATPTNVSFAYVGAGEETCPASGETGYFNTYPIGPHLPTGDGTNNSYGRLDANNQHDCDNAIIICGGLPYTNGTAAWQIPTYWITVNAYNTNGPVHLFPNSPIAETFTMNNTGNVVVSKYGATAP